MTWQTFVIELVDRIGLAGILGTIFGALVTLLIQSRVERRGAEHQVRFSVLHQRVADTIEGLYTRLDAAMRAARATVAELEIGETDKNELAQDAYRKAGEFLEYLWPHRLYLKDDFAVRLEKLAKSLRLNIRRFARGINPQNKAAPPAPDDFWDKALQGIEEEAKSVFSELHKEFQLIIGFRVN